jgi:hypothetical protein
MTNDERDLLAGASVAQSQGSGETRSPTTIVKGLKTCMRYRLRLFDKTDRYVAGQFVHCENDSHARSHADKMLARTGIARVEVWDGQRQVYQKERRSAALPAESADDRDEDEELPATSGRAAVEGARPARPST